jgi:hypothetical protein
MHEYTDRADQLRPGMDGNRACLTCHEAARFEGAPHTHHRAGSSGALCYNCHMPHTSYALLKAIRQHEIDSPRVTTTLRTGRPNACNLCHIDQTLAWTASRLTEWYGQPAEAVPEEHALVSAIVRGLLTGDAGQRALAAWHLSWAPAREVAGSDWQAPLLARLLSDPYSAVRYLAHDSLRRLPGYTNFGFNFVGPGPHQADAAAEAARRWTGAAAARNPEQRKALLLRDDGTSDLAAVEALLRRRDDRPMHLRE